ncbi:unnamed protein product [Sphagnum balticum]
MVVPVSKEDYIVAVAAIAKDVVVEVMARVETKTMGVETAGTSGSIAVAKAMVVAAFAFVAVGNHAAYVPVKAVGVVAALMVHVAEELMAAPLGESSGSPDIVAIVEAILLKHSDFQDWYWDLE